VTTDGHVALVRQYRYALECVTAELPSGAIEEGETPLEAAERELLEEAGLVSRQWTHLGTFWTMPGRGDEQAYLYLARDVAHSTQPRVRDDAIEMVLVPIDEAAHAVRSVRDALCLRLAADVLRNAASA
jgi:8-oxo-dGTP pyrophosphatase MutT (NUDIX family)